MTRMTRNSSFKAAAVAAAFLALAAGHAAAQCTHTPAPIVISTAGAEPWTGNYTFNLTEGNTIPNPACAFAGSSNQREVVFEWTAPASGNYKFSTNNAGTTLGGDPDTKVWVFTNCASAAATAIACADDVSATNYLTEALGTAVGGTTYFISVEGWASTGNGQTVQLDITSAPTAPAHDLCASAMAITSLPFSDSSVDLTICGDEGFDIPASVTGGGTGGKDVYYTFTPATTGDYRFFGSGTPGAVDVGIGIFTGACGSLVEVASVDDFSAETLFQTLTSGTAYTLSVGGYNAASAGPIIVGLSGPVAAASPGGDDCTTPIAVTTVPYADLNVDMSRSDNWLNFGGVSYAGDRIYRFTAPSSDTFNFQIDPVTTTFDPQIIALNDDCVTLGIFPGSVGTMDIGGSDDPETLSFPMTAGQIVILYFQDFNGFGGTANFNFNAGAKVGDWSTY